MERRLFKFGEGAGGGALSGVTCGREAKAALTSSRL